MKNVYIMDAGDTPHGLATALGKEFVPGTDLRLEDSSEWLINSSRDKRQLLLVLYQTQEMGEIPHAIVVEDVDTALAAQGIFPEAKVIVYTNEHAEMTKAMSEGFSAFLHRQEGNIMRDIMAPQKKSSGQTKGK